MTAAQPIPVGFGAIARGASEAGAVNPELTVALERLVDPDSRGDPELPLRWTIKSTRQLSAALTGQGIRPASGWCGGCCTRRATMPEEPRKLRISVTDTPLGRAGRPAELASVYVSLAPRKALHLGGTGGNDGRPTCVVTAGAFLQRRDRLQRRDHQGAGHISALRG